MADPPRRAAVLGRPIAHTLSPVLHRAAYAALGVDWTYDAIDCGEDDLAALLMSREDWAGFSCTMPLKRAALAVADEVRPRAAAIGAANTLLPRAGGGWIAENTDVTGIVSAVREAGVAASSAAVLGAGGTAQAAVAAFAELGLSRCTVVVRSHARTDELRASAHALGVAIELQPLDELGSELSADLVVSTVPAGAADRLATLAWRRDQAVLDAVYDPWPTPLAVAARQAGATVLSGGLMLLHQAAAQVELMTGRLAPLDAMRAALRQARPNVGV